jgi:hypothetical protein
MIASDSTVDINAGDSVTVVVLNATGLDVGTTYGFLAYGLVLDSSAVLQETWRADASTSARRTAFLDEYRSARTIAEDQVTFDHLPEVDLVIAGVVTSVDTTALPDSIARKNRFETAPAWRRAALRVRRILRGDSALTAGTVPLLFPGGTHIIYSTVPRPQTGDSGVYLVHGTGRFAGMSFAGLDTAGTFVLFHSVDVRPLGDTARVIRLLHAVRPTRAPAPD